MPSLTAKDRISLCLFSFTDGRRCRTPRTGNHPHFCFYHAQKETRARAAETLGKDLAYFFSGDYLSACDLNTALSRLIPAVVRGDIKPRLARTVAYMFQTQLQAIRLSQHEYINAFGTDGWRKASAPPSMSTLTTASHQSPATPRPNRNSPNHLNPSARTHNPSNPTASTPQTPSRPHQPATAPPQPASPTNHPAAQTAQPNNAAPAAPPRPQPQPTTSNRDPYAVHFDHNYRLRESPKLL